MQKPNPFVSASRICQASDLKHGISTSVGDKAKKGKELVSSISNVLFISFKHSSDKWKMPDWASNSEPTHD
jgi:hypothetical protein